MYKNIRFWQLYIFPFLVIGIILLKENATLFIGKHESFISISKNTNTLTEIDSDKLEKAYVKKVVDGDTIILDSSIIVRYIGVDTPETVHPKKSVQCFGKEASIKNKALVENKFVYLEKDVTDKDRYGRLLRYVYLPNPDFNNEVIFVNEYLIEQGYAKILTYPPDVKHHSKFIEAYKNAQKAKRGLWQKCLN